jgi:SPX domain protein involved in polyphosphate accumulation
MRIYKVLVTKVYDYTNGSIGEIIGYDQVVDYDWRLKTDGFYVDEANKSFVINLDARIGRPYEFIFEKYQEMLKARILLDTRESKLGNLLDDGL